MSSKSKTEKFWDRFADKFDKRAKNFAPLPVEETKKYLKSSDIVLDFGCATGTVVIEIADCVKEAVGIDISSKMIAIAQRKASEHNIENIAFRQATLFDKEFENETFDVIIAFNIIHFFKDTQELVQRMYKLLKSNGLVIIKTVCHGKITFSNILQKLLLSPMVLMKLIPYIKFTKIPDLKEALCKQGFDIITVENLKNTDYFIVAKKSMLKIQTNR